jgi:SAM-dependent methyltransferase
MTTKILRNLTAKDISTLQERTVSHYHQSALSFWEGTKDHDVNQNREALLRNIESESPHRILDFGCGPGRDLIAFKELGHIPVGLDGCENFVNMARQKSGCDVLHQEFLKLDLPQSFFDGIFANASMFHVPTQELPRVLRELRASLKPGGVLFCSNPHGPDLEQFNQERYGAFLRYETWCGFVTEAGFMEIEHYYRPPGKPRDQQAWLATVWRRI